MADADVPAAVVADVRLAAIAVASAVAASARVVAIVGAKAAASPNTAVLMATAAVFNPTQGTLTTQPIAAKAKRALARTTNGSTLAVAMADLASSPAGLAAVVAVNS